MSTSQNLGTSYPDINRIYISGTLLHDPPLRHTRKGVPVTNFIIITAPDSDSSDADSERKPCYISVVVWSKQAIQCSKNLKKGSPVVILGELQSMPNSNPNEEYFPVQISAQWIQYL